jgi:hypothetical protein
VNQDDLDEVPLTESDKTDIAEAWLAYIHALPPGVDPHPQVRESSGMFRITVNRILLAHGFEPFSGSIAWNRGNELVVMARRLPTTEPIDR